MPPATPTSSPHLFADDSILPPDPVDDDGESFPVLHDREYRVRAYLLSEERVLIRGAVRDQKPPGLYVDGDPDPLTVHHMQIDLHVAYPSLEIVAAEARMLTNPHHECPTITDHYGELVGLSIARGFTHRVRELFGGPRGCTHTTALLQAMAPVAVQCMWSVRAVAQRREPGSNPFEEMTPEQREAAWMMNLNTCHVWSEDGPWVEAMRSGAPMPPPVWAEERLVSLGRKPDDWRTSFD